MRGLAKAWVLGLALVAVAGTAVAQAPDAQEPAPGITLGMTMRRAVRVCRARGDQITAFYESGGQSASLPLGARPPHGLTLSGMKCAGAVGELWISLAPSTPPRFVVTEARGSVTPSGLGVTAHQYALQVTQRYGTPRLEMRGGRRRPTLEWVVPQAGTACAASDRHVAAQRDHGTVTQTNAPCAALFALTFAARSENADSTSILFALTPLPDVASMLTALGDEPSTSTAPAAQGHVSVLGVRLLASTRIASCGDTATSVLLAAGVPCIPSDADLDGAWTARGYAPQNEIFLGDSRAVPRDVDLWVGSLLPVHCPSWLDRECLLSIALIDRKVAGLAFRTAPPAAESQVRQQLRAMFGPEHGDSTATTCRNAEDGTTIESARHQWTTPELSIEYTPATGPTCTQGLVRIQNTQLRDALERR